MTLRLFVTNDNAGLEGVDVLNSGVINAHLLAAANAGWVEGTGVGDRPSDADSG